eukprot:maker-scaffold1435_size41353-snap-gene-0.13 protein:Tk10250 transcript:maker-scaffold1435_size41353-snap-gene-0.13-mRNA-1 annotation:"o-linked transferase"
MSNVMDCSSGSKANHFKDFTNSSTGLLGLLVNLKSLLRSRTNNRDALRYPWMASNVTSMGYTELSLLEYRILQVLVDFPQPNLFFDQI